MYLRIWQVNKFIDIYNPDYTNKSGMVEGDKRLILTKIRDDCMNDFFLALSTERAET